MTAEVGPLLIVILMSFLQSWGISALRHSLWCCLFSVLVILLNYRPTVFALKQKAC